MYVRELSLCLSLPSTACMSTKICGTYARNTYLCMISQTMALFCSLASITWSSLCSSGDTVPGNKPALANMSIIVRVPKLLPPPTMTCCLLPMRRLMR